MLLRSCGSGFPHNTKPKACDIRNAQQACDGGLLLFLCAFGANAGAEASPLFLKLQIKFSVQEHKIVTMSDGQSGRHGSAAAFHVR